MSVGTRLLSTRPVGTGMVIRLSAVLQILHDMTPYFMYENMAYRFVYQILLDSFALYSFLCLSILFYMASDAYSTYVYLHQEWSRVRETMHN